MSVHPDYCRRTTTLPDGSERICNKRIGRVNPLDWCADCRASHLPFWPADADEARAVAPAAFVLTTCSDFILQEVMG